MKKKYYNTSTGKKVFITQTYRGLYLKKMELLLTFPFIHQKPIQNPPCWGIKEY